MSVDVLQEKIRKLKNPSVLVVEPFIDLIPPSVLEAQTNTIAAMDIYFNALLQELSDIIPAVRFSFSGFALLGEEGITLLKKLMAVSQKKGYYVFVDIPQPLSLMAAENTARMLCEKDTYVYDGIVLPTYLGSDIIKPFLALCKLGKAVFPIIRTSNKSAAEIQDLLTGGRLVHTAVADIVNRLGTEFTGKCGYSSTGFLAAASSADSLRNLRSKYKNIFLLLDGCDYPNANAKNCSYAFDGLGHGAAACVGVSVLGAWREAKENGDYAQQAVDAAMRLKKNLTRYISVL